MEKNRVQGGWGGRGTPQNKFTHIPVKKVEERRTEKRFASLVVHCQKSSYDVYIGRPNPKVNLDSQKCVWGNPFRIGDDGNRDEVLKKYQNWLTTTPEGGRVLEHARRELRGKVLGCWCAPLACHGHVLAEFANESQIPNDSVLTKPLSYQSSVLLDGCVLIRNAFNLEEQQVICNQITKYGNGLVEGVGSFFGDPTKILIKDGYVDPSPESSDPSCGILNLNSKARMNVPFDMSPLEVWKMCQPLLEVARALCPSIPLLDPTVWRLNFYSKSGQIGWHFDRHPYVPLDQQHTVKVILVDFFLFSSPRLLWIFLFKRG
eukprot:TRINITY_DN2103_c0_g2_i9.p1 TRINITY_DN2103_c0_g2~~TRINITY_DN2103_c0_g2_i9.p1  ORF type:complete len:318 (+),score=48.91 TRINITY_DN2103_c0_g2_i9:3-956(+)